MFQGYRVRPSSQTNKRACALPGSDRKGLLKQASPLVQPTCNYSSPRAFPSLSPQCSIVRPPSRNLPQTVKAGSEDTEDHGTRLHSLTEFSPYICHSFPVCQPLGVQEGHLGMAGALLAPLKGSPWNLYPHPHLSSPSLKMEDLILGKEHS